MCVAAKERLKHLDRLLHAHLCVLGFEVESLVRCWQSDC